MERQYKPIKITEYMINTKSYTIPIDKENFIAIDNKDNELDFEDTLCGKLYKILGHDNADYNYGFVGTNIYIDVDMLNHDKLIKEVEECIDAYTIQARIESDFFSDGENENLVTEAQENLISFMVMDARTTNSPEDMAEIEAQIINEVLSMSDRECIKKLEEELK